MYGIDGLVQKFGVFTIKDPSGDETIIGNEEYFIEELKLFIGYESWVVIQKHEVTAETEIRAVTLVHYKLNSDNWIFKLERGNNEERDCVIGLVQNEEYHNRKIEE